MVFFKIALASMLIVCGFHVAASTFEWTTLPTCPIKIPENTTTYSLYTFTGPNGTNNYTVHALNGTDVLQFSIAPNGTLRTQNSLDYEKPSGRGAFALNITAINGTDNATINCIIEITDVNDVTPTFSKATYFVSVKNNTQKGTGILNVTATDGDVSPEFNTLTYSIKNEPNSANFTIDTKGAITAATNLTVPSAQNFTITVEAFDKKNTGSANVTVCVGCTTDGLTDSQKKDSPTGDQTDGEKGSGAVSRASLLALVTLLLSLFVL